MQYQLYQMAEQKGYYHPAPGANQNDVQHIKNSLLSGMNGGSTMNFASGGQTNQNVMSDSNSQAMINSNMMNTTNATNAISSNIHTNNKKSKKVENNLDSINPIH